MCILKNCVEKPPTGHPVEAVKLVGITREAASELEKLADPAEIAVAALIGAIKGTSCLITGAIRLPNEADTIYPAKGRQRAWSVDWHAIEHLEVEAERVAPNTTVLGILHTHRHGKSLPSALDWRRPRARDLAAIYHPGSGILTLYIRGTTKRKGRVVARLAATKPVTGYAAAVDLEKAGTLCPLTTRSP